MSCAAVFGVLSQNFGKRYELKFQLDIRMKRVSAWALNLPKKKPRRGGLDGSLHDDVLACSTRSITFPLAGSLRVCFVRSTKTVFRLSRAQEGQVITLFFLFVAESFVLGLIWHNQSPRSEREHETERPDPAVLFTHRIGKYDKVQAVQPNTKFNDESTDYLRRFLFGS
jgi:hypothetical protein